VPDDDNGSGQDTAGGQGNDDVQRRLVELLNSPRGVEFLNSPDGTVLLARMEALIEGAHLVGAAHLFGGGQLFLDPQIFADPGAYWCRAHQGIVYGETILVSSAGGPMCPDHHVAVRRLPTVQKVG
jgi:hypothetical protein